MIRRALLVLMAALVVALPTPARSATGPIAHREVLPNGLVLLVAERPAVPIVAVRVYTTAGAVFDPPDRAGLANVTGALVTRGTSTRTAPEIDSAIEFVGGSLEAGAGRDGLTASLAVQKRDLPLGLDLLQDVVLHPAFPEAEFKRKVAEIQAAIKRSEEDPGTVARRALAALVFPQHPYGRPVEGTRESVARITRDDVVGFYGRHVRADTTVIAVVGAVTVEEARREISSRFGAWRPPENPPEKPPVASGTVAPRSEAIKRELTQATIAFGRQAIRQSDPDYYPLAVASYILGGGSVSRLYTRVREAGGLAYAVYSYLAPGKYGASLVADAQTRTAEVPKVTDIIRDELGRMTREKVGEHELSLARSYLIGSFPFRLDTSSKVADFIVAVEVQGLGLDYADRYVERIQKVTADDVLRAASRYLQPDSFSLVKVGDFK